MNCSNFVTIAQDEAHDFFLIHSCLTVLSGIFEN